MDGGNLDPNWLKVEAYLNDLDPAYLSDPVFRGIAKGVTDIAAHDGPDPLKILKRMSGGSRSRALDLVMKNIKEDFRTKYADVIEEAFDVVLPAFADGLDFEWEEE